MTEERMKPINFGICGLGRIGLVHGKRFSEDRERYRFVAACDRNPARTANAAAEYNGAACNSLTELLAHPALELVIVSTPSRLHTRHALQALEAGKTVLLEKPVAVTADDLAKLEKADQDYPGKLFFLHNHRFEPAFQHIRRLLAENLLGDVFTIKLCRHHPFRFRNDWQSMLEHGGGQLSCWGPHIIDHALQLLQSPVRSVWSRLDRINTPGDADDHVKILLTGANDRTADIEISDAIALPGPYCALHGTRGSLVCPDQKRIHLRYIDPDVELPRVTVSSEAPPQSGVASNAEGLPWIEKTLKVEPDTNMWDHVETETARHLHAALRQGIPFPIRSAEAFAVVRIAQIVKSQNPQFAWAE